LDDFKERARKEFASALDQALQESKVDLNLLSRRLHDMIDYAIGRVDYYERYRTTYQTIALGMVSGALVIASFLIKSPSTAMGFRESFYVASSLSLLIGGLSILLKYYKETAPDYPYRKVADIRSWYYIYNVPDRKTNQSYQERVQEYCDGFKSYIGSWIERASNANSLILEDIEQVYILFQLQGYKREAAKRMSKIALIAAVAASVFLAIGLFYDQIKWLAQLLFSNLAHC